jgi:hypothetical protein
MRRTTEAVPGKEEKILRDVMANFHMTAVKNGPGGIRW